MEASMKINNLVAKNAHLCNRAATHKDRKKALKRGAVKHKRRLWDE